VVDHRQGAIVSNVPTSPTLDPHAEAERKLIRPTEGRVVAGVAAGLSSYFGISPIVYRVAFAALVLLGGSGLILYAAAWLIIPDERRGVSVVEEAITKRRGTPLLALGVVLVGLGLVFGIAGGRYWSNPDRAWLPLLAIGLAIVWWQLQENDRAAREPGSAGSSPAGASASTTLAPSRRRFPVFLPVMGVIVAGAGILGILQATDAVEVNWTLALAGGVVLIGLATAVGAFYGGVGGLAAAGAVLAAVLIAVATIDLPLHGPMGDRTVHPTTVHAVHDRYRQSIGKLRLDLGDVAFPQETTEVHASVGVGNLEVIVPPDAIVQVHATVGAGDATIFGVHDNGWKVDRDMIVDRSKGLRPTLVVDTHVGIGELEVRRA
jgi:phage shock protein PspC (stress-responsive transcriptional regulator)